MGGYSLREALCVLVTALAKWILHRHRKRLPPRSSVARASDPAELWSKGRVTREAAGEPVLARVA
jgi:hypothetical protein